jgi:hypothetical protein
MSEAEIMAAMLSLYEQGVEMVEVDFSGSGDSGDIDEWRYLDSESDEIDIDEKSKAIIKKIGEEIINNNYDYDWYNNEGGRGTLYMNLKEKTWNIDGVQYVEEPNSEEGELIDILTKVSIKES